MLNGSLSGPPGRPEWPPAPGRIEIDRRAAIDVAGVGQASAFGRRVAMVLSDM
jgi:hypothetical protein